VFTARYALSPYLKQIRFVFKGLNNCAILETKLYVCAYRQNMLVSVIPLNYSPLAGSVLPIVCGDGGVIFVNCPVTTYCSTCLRVI
jgi:hypothetical protein